MTSIKQLIDLTEKTALITGATGHIGKVFADTLSELGSSLILVDKSFDSLFSLQENLQKKWNNQVHILECDLEIQPQRSNLINYVNSNFPSLNILVNNAAFVGSSNLDGWAVPFELQSIETWNRVLEINLTAVFDLCKGFNSLMKKSTSGSIINISSIYGMYGPKWELYEHTSLGNPAAYAVSKSAVIGFTRWLARTIAPEIRVNSIAPGGVFRNQNKNFVTKYTAATPLNRMATEDDLRGPLAYLASDLSKYVTGQVLIVDGGWGV